MGIEDILKLAEALQAQRVEIKPDGTVVLDKAPEPERWPWTTAPNTLEQVPVWRVPAPWEPQIFC